MPELPQEIASKSSEDMIRLAFSVIDPEVFPAPSWLLGVEAINSVDLHHAEVIVAQHSCSVAEMAEDRLKHGYLQGVLDAAMMQESDRQATTR